MTKRDFFRILIKVFGLYSLITVLFTTLPSNLSIIIYDLEIAGIIYMLIILALIALIFLFLIRKPDAIIHLLKLDKGFDEERIYFEKLNAENIVKLAAIIIGGLLLIRNIPFFISHSYFAFKFDISRQGLNQAQMVNWAANFLNIIIGYLLVAKFEKIGSWIKGSESTQNGSATDDG